MHLFGVLELPLYPGSIFLFDESPQSALFSVAMLAFSIMATIALCALAAMILYGIFRGVVGTWQFLQRHGRISPIDETTALSRNKFSVFATTPCRGLSRSR
jgi:hypothetical protein